MVHLVGFTVGTDHHALSNMLQCVTVSAYNMVLLHLSQAQPTVLNPDPSSLAFILGL